MNEINDVSGQTSSKSPDRRVGSLEKYPAMGNVEMLLVMGQSSLQTALNYVERERVK
jgi:hypothetical protein